MMRALLTGMALVLALPVAAETVGGVELDSAYRFDDSTELTLHGAGVREKYFFDIYVAALYLDQTDQPVQRMLGRDEAGRIEMHFVYDEIERERLVEAWRDSIRANHDREVRGAVAGRLARFLAQMPAMSAGDTLALTYRPGEGTRMVVNGGRLDTFDGGVFFRTLLGALIGPEPPDTDLKRGLLAS